MRAWALSVFLGVGFCLAISTHVGATTHYTLQSLGAAAPSPSDINDAGQVVGGNDNGNAAWLWQKGVTTPLPKLTPGGLWDYARSINNDGIIAGSSTKNYPAPTLWGTDHMPVDLQPAQFFAEGDSFGINDSGMITGGYSNVSANYRAFVWDATDGLRNITTGMGSNEGDGINASGVVAGWGEGNNGLNVAFKWSAAAGQTILPPLSKTTLEYNAYAINDSGQIVGDSREADRSEHAVLWQQDGTIVDLGSTNGLFFEPRSINDAGQVIGNESVGSGSIPFIWSNGHLDNLQNVLDGADGWTIVNVMGINNLGQIVGEGHQDGAGYAGILLTPVPEPGLAGAIGIGLALIRRRAGFSA